MVLGAGLLFLLARIPFIDRKTYPTARIGRAMYGKFVFLNRSSKLQCFDVDRVCRFYNLLDRFIPAILPPWGDGRICQPAERSVIVWLAVVGAVTMLLVILERGKESIASIILGKRHGR
jgi:hypothetical protein